MSYVTGKISNYTGADTLLNLEDLNDYFKSVDKDLQNLFYMSSPIWQFSAGSQYDYLQAQGDGTWTATSVIGGWNITGNTLYGGTGGTYIGLRPGTGIWLGDEAFLDAPFSIDPAGVAKVHSGNVGGWYLGTTEIKSNATSADAAILLDQTNGLMRVGPTSATYITVDGTNKKITSSDYVSGPLGAGFGITTALSEFQNIRARGKLVGATFEKDVISSVGGNFLVSDSDILNADMTASDGSTLTILGDTTFGMSDILRIRDGVDDEWLVITDTASAPTYSVTRDQASAYSANTNPAWTIGTPVVNYGVSGEGLIFMTASEANSPHIDVLTHAGAPWTTTTTRMRMGNVNGFLGAATDLYGIYIGESAKYLKYDPTNGLQVKGVVTMSAGSDIEGLDATSVAGWAHASDTTMIDGGDIYTGSVTADKITAATISAIQTLTGSIKTAATGARVEVFPDANTGLIIYNTSGASVLSALVGGTDTGDVIIGDYAGNNGLKWDQSASTFYLRGTLQGGDIVAETISTGKLDVTAQNNLAKGWASISVSAGTPTLNSSFNVSGIVDAGAGRVTVTWDTDFSDTNYTIASSCDGTGLGTFIVGASVKAAGNVQITAIRWVNGNEEDPVDYTCVAFGP